MSEYGLWAIYALMHNGAHQDPYAAFPDRGRKSRFQRRAERARRQADRREADRCGTPLYCTAPARAG